MVELPELTDNQRLYLKTIFDYFHTKGKWPTFLKVENTIRDTHPEKWPEFDLLEVCQGLPDHFASHFAFNRTYEQEASFIAPVLSYFPEAAEERSDFIRVIRLCVEKVNTSTEVRPEIKSTDLKAQLHMNPLSIRKMGLLLSLELFTSGGGSNVAEDSWNIYLKREKDGVRSFSGVTTFEQYLEKSALLTHTFSSYMTKQPGQSQQSNNMSSPVLATTLREAQYTIVPRHQSPVTTREKGLQKALKVFFCYAHEDQKLLKNLKNHLKPLEREGLIQMWHDQDISPGVLWEKEIHERLNEAHIILLLISPDFMASEYCYSIEMKRALERHKQGEVGVIPIILRSVYWERTLGNLQALPTGTKAIQSSHWQYPDDAFRDVVVGIGKVVTELSATMVTPLPSTQQGRTDKKQQTYQKQSEQTIMEVSIAAAPYQLFLADILERLKKVRPDITNAKVIQSPRSGWFAAGKAGFYFQWNFRDTLQTELLMNIAGDYKKTKNIFDFLFQHRQEIEQEFGTNLEWLRQNDQKESYIVLSSVPYLVK